MFFKTNKWHSKSSVKHYIKFNKKKKNEQKFDHFLEELFLFLIKVLSLQAVPWNTKNNKIINAFLKPVATHSDV